MLKRLVDVIVSLIGLVLTSPLLLAIAVAIKRDSPGPVFYRGARIGRHGRSFKIYKFRTVVENPQELAQAITRLVAMKPEERIQMGKTA